MIRTLIVYESKYGFTERIAYDLMKILGPANICKPENFSDEYKEFDLFVICSPVYKESLDKKIVSFIKDNKKWLREKKVVFLCSSLLIKGAEKYFEEVEEMLDNNILWKSGIGGVLDINRLDSSDYIETQQFTQKVGIPFKSYNTFNKVEFRQIALKIKKLKDESKGYMDKIELKKYIDEFLKSHNTCTLCTGYEDDLRATAIEYSYLDDYIYFISEGGEKFAHLLLNHKVSIAIYDPFKSMGNLGGLQLNGVAEEVKETAKEYIEVLEERGLKYSQLKSLPIKMNVIRVSIKKAEFLWSDFKKLGYEAKQVYFNEL